MKPREKYQILVKADRIADVLDSWLYHSNHDITLRVAKTKGCRVIETTDTLYAARVVKYLAAAEKVNIVKL